MFCKFCGKDLSDDAVFCSGCGKKLVMEVSGKIAVEEKLNYEPPSVGQVTEQTIEKSDANETDVVKFDSSAKELEEVAAVSDGADKMEAVDEEKAVQVFSDAPDELKNTKDESIPVEQKKHKKWSGKKKTVFFSSAVAILIAVGTSVGITVGKKIRVDDYVSKNWPSVEKAKDYFNELVRDCNGQNTGSFLTDGFKFTTDPEEVYWMMDAGIDFLNRYLDFYVGYVRVASKNNDFSPINGKIESAIAVMEGNLKSSQRLLELGVFFYMLDSGLTGVKKRWENIRIKN